MKSLTNYFEQDIDLLPDLLPIVHVTTFNKLKKIIGTGVIESNKVCSVINKAVTFFNYGGAFYRIIDDKDAIELPIALMYKPSILKEADEFLPYDSGAIKSRLYGHWNDELSNFGKYYVPVESAFSASKYIKMMFGNNYDYLQGRSRALPEDFPEKLLNLSKFYKEPRGKMPNGLDSRRHAIELHFSKPISISDQIMWVAIPNSKKNEIKEIKKIIGYENPIEVFYYDVPETTPAYDISNIINLRARDFLQKKDLGCTEIYGGN
jgi:hypothetical protein